jgi:hypothetical protein
MARQFLFTVITAAIVLSTVATGEAAGRRFAHRHGPSPTALYGSYGTPHNLPANYRYNPYYAFKAMNPQYYGGIHARTTQNIGMPNGDIGLRGNGLTLTPW